jgi:predicted nucleic acid-binding protein
MANDVEIKVTADTSNAEGGFQKVKSGFSGMKDSIVKNKKTIGLGIAAMGVGIEGLAKSQQGLTESSRKLANATGMSEKEIRGMATSLSNATFPLDSALELMTLGAQQGLDSADALKEYATFWDTVGDATGLSAEALAKSGAALAAVGIEVGNESTLLGAFGLITQESTQSVQDFLSGIEKLAPEMSAMGISVDEAAVIMTAMERELGLTARTARTEFKEALEQSETGLAGVLEQLGLSESQLATYQTTLEESTGVIQDNADAHASTKTVMDKLKSSLADVVFQNGALLEKASMLAPIFMVAGPAIAGVSGIMGVMTGITSAAKVAMVGLNLSMGPILIAVVGVAAAIAAAILIWQNWDTIVNFLKDSIGFLKDVFVKAFERIKSVFETVTDVVFGLYESKLGWLLPFGPLVKGIIFLKDKWKDIWNKIKMTFDTIVGFIQGIYNSKLGWLLPAGPLIKGIIFLKDKWREIFGNIKDFTIGIFDSIVSVIKGAINTIIGAINTVIRGINNFKLEVPAVKVGPVTITPGFSMGLPQIPEIPALAKGGVVTRPTLAMLGESGPEAVVPLGRGGGAGMTVNLVINGDINGMDDFEQKVTAVIRDAVLGGGFSGVLARA